jgi:hypothetical protein
MNMTISRLLFGFIILLIFGATNATADILYVNSDLGNDANNGTSVALAFQHIRNALQNASPGDSVYVVAGSAYNESTIYFFNNSVTLSGYKSDNTSPAWTVCTPGASSDAPEIIGDGSTNPLMRMNASGITIQGFKINMTNGSTSQGINIETVTDPTIQYCTFMCNGSDEAIRIDNNETTDFIIDHNNFTNSTGSSAKWFIVKNNAKVYKTNNTANVLSTNIISGMMSVLDIGSNVIHDIIYTKNTHSNTADGILLTETTDGAGTFGDIAVFGNTFNGGGSANFAFKVDGSVEDADFEDGSYSADDVKVNFNSFGRIGSSTSQTVMFPSTPSVSLNAETNWWGSASGPNGTNTANVSANVDYTPYITGAIEHRGSDYGQTTYDNSPYVAKVELSAGTSDTPLIGSAQYALGPVNSTELEQSKAVAKYVDVFVSGYTGTSALATVTVYYNDTDVTSSGVTEDTLIPYLWTGSAWVQASSVGRSTNLNKVWGTFLVSSMTGSPIGLAGDNYSVTILPVEAPGVIRTTKPIFTTFTIESSTTDLNTVYYQLDNYTNSSGWTAIQSNINAKTWNWPGWSMTDSDWASLGNGTHTIYIKFTRTGSTPAIGDAGEISWQFFKSVASPADTYVTVVQPNGGETLTRDPYTITWTLTSTTSLDYITVYYSRDGGTTYPYRVARIGNTSSSLTSYIWRSPNIYTNQARIKVVARYIDGTEYSDTSDANFNITKGYSFNSYRPGAGYTSFRSWGRPGYSFRAG